MNRKTSEILKNHQLKQTEVRKKVLDLFLSENHALSHQQLEEAMQKQFDRVTLYRTLNSFEEKGIIHQVLDDDNRQKYAMCSDNCDEHEHNDRHIHFKCDSCGHTFCLENITIPEIHLPNGYVAGKFSFLVTGLCNKCSK